MKQLYLFMFDITLLYISVPSSVNINTPCTLVDRQRFPVFRLDQ